jgi:hypothetical protein
MATDAENVETLKRIKANLLAQIEEATLNPKPTYTIRNQTVQWQAYIDGLWMRLEKIDGLINANTGFFDIESFGY